MILRKKHNSGVPPIFDPTESDAASLECILSRTYIQSKNIRKPLNVQKISALRFSLSVSKEET